MILIFGSNENDIETDLVLKWLMTWNIPFFKITPELLINSKVNISESFININGNKYFYREFEVIYVRRWMLTYPNIGDDSRFDSYSNKTINSTIQKEWEIMFTYLLSKFEDNKLLVHPKLLYSSKLEQLEQAKKFGLLIPKFTIENFPSQEKEYGLTITKPMTNLGYLNSADGSKVLTSYTQFYSDYKSEKYFFSLVQENISSQIEVRCNFVDGEFYCLGMLKEDNPNQTIPDLKKSQYRTFNIELPIGVKESIKKLMSFYQSKLGILDFIKVEDKYYFLEINPIGKFAFYSNKGNLSLDYCIAKLIKNIYESK